METETSLDRTHYDPAGLLAKVQAALAALGPEQTVLSTKQLAALDQFHTRGILATGELAKEMGLAPGMTVLDLGCGLGGPARHLAETYGVDVTGVDLSESLIETARYLSRRCNLADRTTFLVGDAADPPAKPGSIDGVFLQHVAMNIADRGTLYRAIRRVLRPGGRFGTYDVVARAGDSHFPLPWARTGKDSHLLSEAQTREELSAAGFHIEVWRDDTEIATQWFAAVQAAGLRAGPSLALVLGPDFPVMTANLARNLGEGRLGVLMAVGSC